MDEVVVVVGVVVWGFGVVGSFGGGEGGVR